MGYLSFIAFCAVFAVCIGDKLDSSYLPPNSAQTAGGNGAFLAAPTFGNKQGVGFAGSGPSDIGNQRLFGKSHKYNQGVNVGQTGYGALESESLNEGGQNRESGFSGSATGAVFGKPQGGPSGHAQSSLNIYQGKVGQPQKLQDGSGLGRVEVAHSEGSSDYSGNSGKLYQHGSSSGYPGPLGSQEAYRQEGHVGVSSAYTREEFKSQGQDIPILAYNNMNNGDGSYTYNYETGNGIKAEESGHLQGDAQTAQGAFSFIAPDGVEYSVTYTADENGFHANGAHLPTPPPIPEAILKSIEQNAREAANSNRQHYTDGDDGSYKEEGNNSFGPLGSAAFTALGSGSFGSGPSSVESVDSTGYHY